MRILNILTLSFVLFTLTSCSEKGPKGNVYIPDKDIDEVTNEIFEAKDGDGWLYQFDVDLHTRVNGEWINVGSYSVYSNLSGVPDDDECSLWVSFGNGSYKMPAYYTDDYGYNYKVKWQGDWYYF